MGLYDFQDFFTVTDIKECQAKHFRIECCKIENFRYTILPVLPSKSNISVFLYRPVLVVFIRIAGKVFLPLFVISFSGLMHEIAGSIVLLHAYSGVFGCNAGRDPLAGFRPRNGHTMGTVAGCASHLRHPSNDTVSVFAGYPESFAQPRRPQKSCFIYSVSSSLILQFADGSRELTSSNILGSRSISRRRVYSSF